MSCMLCKNNVTTNYGKIDQTALDAFIEIYGDKIQPYLTSNRSVCNICMNVLVNLVKLRRTIWNLVTDPNSHQRPNQMAEFWKIFDALNLENDIEPVQVKDTRIPTPNLLVPSYCEPYDANKEMKIAQRERRKSLGTYTENNEIRQILTKKRRKRGYKWTRNRGGRKTKQIQDTRIPTPNLLVPSYCVPYNSNLEMQIAERERSKSLGTNYKTSRSYTENSEVQLILTNKRRRKKGHKWTRKKGCSQTPKSKFCASSVYGRSRKSVTYTPFSEIYFESTYSSRSRPTFSRKKLRSLSPKIRISTKGTRSVSRLEEKAKNSSSSNYFCIEKNCNMFSDNIEEMNKHNIEEHAMYNSYFCHECSKIYTTKHLYNLHMKYHNFSFFCLMCGVEQRNSFELQKHLDEHMIYSVSCKCCDKSFLSKLTRDEHSEKCHKGRKKTRLYKNKLILDRIDKTEKDMRQHVENEIDFGPRYFFYTEMDVEQGDTEMTCENLKRKNIPIYREEDEGMTSDLQKN